MLVETCSFRSASHSKSPGFSGVVGARLLAESVVVNLEEVLIEMEPGLRVPLADGGPMNCIEHSSQCSKGGLERRLALRVVCEEPEGRPDERTCLAQLLRHLSESRRK